MTTLASLFAQVETVTDGNDTALIIAGIVSIALGVLIFAVPRLLNYIVAGYLVIVGIIWLVAGL
jgi:hypothetical protein